MNNTNNIPRYGAFKPPVKQPVPNKPKPSPILSSVSSSSISNLSRTPTPTRQIQTEVKLRKDMPFDYNQCTRAMWALMLNVKLDLNKDQYIKFMDTCIKLNVAHCFDLSEIERSE